MRLALIVMLLVASSLAKNQPEDAGAAVFLGPLSAKLGAPSADGLRMRVILTAVADDPAWKGVFETLRARGYDKVISYKVGKVAAAFRELKRLRPAYVAVVIPHDQLDVNWHFDFLERAAKLDGDPFVDFAFGYITGATPAEATAFVRGIAAVAAGKKKLPRTIVEFAPVPKPYGPTRAAPHKVAKGWTTRGLWHKHDDQDIAQRLSKLKGVGIYRASGHGMPDGIDHGLSGRALRESGLQMHPALYFSGPCYCGVTSRWFRYRNGQAKEERVAPEDSFVLSLIRAGTTGVFAGLDPDRGETNHHEMEHVLVTGEPLGLASKATYDDVVVAYRRKALELPEHRPGKGWPFRDIHDQMISGAACRALFGDPTFAPVAAAGEDPFRAEHAWTKKGLEVVWKRGSDVGKYWAPVDVLRGEGGWTHRIRLRVDLSLEDARRVTGCRSVVVTKDGETVPHIYATAAVEEWGGEGRVHLMVVFSRHLKKKALWGGRSYEARFVLRAGR